MQFSLLNLENFNFDFKNEFFPDAVNFGQFATFRGDSFFRKELNFFHSLGNFFRFQNPQENSPKIKSCERFLQRILKIQKAGRESF